MAKSSRCAWVQLSVSALGDGYKYEWRRRMNNIARKYYPACIFLIAIALMSCMPTGKTGETYLIPKGYIGKVIIIYGQANSSELKYENGQQIFRISEKGKLFTSTKWQAGSFPESGLLFFYVDSLNNRIPVKLWKPSDGGNIDRNEIRIFGLKDGDCGTEGQDSIFYYTTFTVDTYNNISHYNKTENCSEYLLR
jgi:hypothetical protein